MYSSQCEIKESHLCHWIMAVAWNNIIKHLSPTNIQKKESSMFWANVRRRALAPSFLHFSNLLNTLTPLRLISIKLCAWARVFHAGLGNHICEINRLNDNIIYWLTTLSWCVTHVLITIIIICSWTIICGKKY
jgi:hypothetical protein